MCFLNLKDNYFEKNICRLIPDIFILDVEEALMETSDVLDDFNRKFSIIEAEEDIDSPGLYQGISTYLKSKTQIGWEFDDLVIDLYHLKTECLKKIIVVSNAIDIIKSDNYLYIIEKNDGLFTEMLKILDTGFIKPAIDISMPWLEDTLPQAYLRDSFIGISDEEPVREFIDSESDIINQEHECVKKFINDLQKKKNAKEIIICDTLPFKFLENPFPSF